MHIIISIYSFVIKHLIFIHKGVFLVKIKSSFSLALAISPIAYFAGKIADWTMMNEAYVVFVLMAIAIDHFLGTIIHFFIKRDFSIKKNIIGLLVKIGMVVSIGLLFEGINEMMKQDESFIISYFVVVLRLTVFMYPAGSAFMNSAIITKGKFPPIGWMNKLKKFQENLNLNDLKDE